MSQTSFADDDMPASKDVLLVGLGAVGAMYSLILKKSGQASVTVVARSNYDAVSKNGMRFKSRKYGDIEGWKPDRLFAKLEHALDRPYSHVVVTTKAIPELTRTPDLLAPLLAPPYASKHRQPTYVLMQNGLGVERDLYNALKKLNAAEEPRIISTAVWIGTTLLAPDVCEHNDFDRVQMGVYRPTTTQTTNTPEEEALLREFEGMLTAGGSDATVYPEIQRVKFAKNFWSCILGASAALARSPLQTIFRPPHMDPGASGVAPPAPAPAPTDATASQQATADIPYRSPAIRDATIPLLHDALAEMHALGSVLFPATADGPGLEPDLALRTLRNTARLHCVPEASHRPSMLVDVEAGRPMELDVVMGEVVRLARANGVPIPRIETIYALLLVVQDQLLRGQRRAS
ncbi:ketopantoate reductase PanE/ApbA C terminal-domain-containing protein [Phanerochaete sordida]|uniref:Ketopantoate reductase PanE/ApbA C terminal-domain-containing protein n=1 Tax=Phanerochaete sordida TaxID=48140 RepID=A0A9P3G141_9APHY|nr:ketopantoate reductase PanE/ApbA C terminal-domain-containing protein [Phanerochaete sordida]